MAIPISNYIDITSREISGVVGERDFSGLVFTKNSMLSSAETSYEEIYEAYEENNEAVELTLSEINACFGSTSKIALFAAKYFSYTGGNSKPSKLWVAKVLTTTGTTLETPLTAYNRIVAQTINFGAFTFLDEGTTTRDYSLANLQAVASANESSDANNIMVVRITTTEGSATGDTSAGTLFAELKYTHVAVTNDIYGAWMVLSWFASVNYDLANASGSIDYKQFSGETAVVTTQALKDTYDGKKFSYVGKVQVYGTGLSFYQQGANMNGTDLGVIRDEAWLKGMITIGYFNLQSANQKLPANYVGCAMVRNLIVDCAMNAINAGAILIDKTLDSTDISTINTYAGNDTAANTVQSSGYYVDVKIVKSGTRYNCEYTLIYAKGDHIGKVEGSHVLV